MVKIAPSMLSADFSKLAVEIKEIEETDFVEKEQD